MGLPSSSNCAAAMGGGIDARDNDSGSTSPPMASSTDFTAIGADVCDTDSNADPYNKSSLSALPRFLITHTTTTIVIIIQIRPPTAPMNMYNLGASKRLSKRALGSAGGAGVLAAVVVAAGVAVVEEAGPAAVVAGAGTDDDVMPVAVVLDEGVAPTDADEVGAVVVLLAVLLVVVVVVLVLMAGLGVGLGVVVVSLGVGWGVALLVDATVLVVVLVGMAVVVRVVVVVVGHMLAIVTLVVDGPQSSVESMHFCIAPLSQNLHI
mmetsp:Transcript_21494/g.36684  ORF Transcript_21494/g.36684 Transcript_21494/m.36684 type:complete len:264 (+) Transcript_21494:305-1096(+)